jgi:hypothetical protein
MIEIHRFGNWRESTLAITATFTCLFLATAAITLWSLIAASRAPAKPWSINLGVEALCVLVIGLLTLNALIAIGRSPEDCGIYTNLGAQRWRETGVIPYGDDELKGADSPGHGAAATYGPILYLSHMPFQALLGTPDNPPDRNPMDEDRSYVPPPMFASALACLTFIAIGHLALYAIGRRLGGTVTALALVALYAGSPYMLGVGGADRLAAGYGPLGGASWISHVGPTAMVLVALWALARPIVAGAALAVATGVLFYPLFLAPTFFGWYFWRRQGAWRFLLGFAITGGIIGAIVITSMNAPEGTNPVSVVLQSTVDHQEGTGDSEYGGTLFSFWNNYPRLASFWQRPLVGDSSLAKPALIVFLGLAAATFFIARGRSEPQLALLIAAVCAGVLLWKTNAAGTYVEWYYPFLLIGLIASSRVEPPVAAQQTALPDSA